MELGGMPNEPRLSTGQSFAAEMPFVSLFKTSEFDSLFKPSEFDGSEAIPFPLGAIPAPATVPNEHPVPGCEFRSANESMQSTPSVTRTLAWGEPAPKVEANPNPRWFALPGAAAPESLPPSDEPVAAEVDPCTDAVPVPLRPDA